MTFQTRAKSPSSLEIVNSIIWRNFSKISSKDEILLKVAETYRKWRNEIIEAFSYKDENGKRLTNAVAEDNNNFLSTHIKISYGYGNFERLRKRALLIKTYNDKYKKRGGLAF